MVYNFDHLSTITCEKESLLVYIGAGNTTVSMLFPSSWVSVEIFPLAREPWILTPGPAATSTASQKPAFYCCSRIISDACGSTGWFPTSVTCKWQKALPWHDLCNFQVAPTITQTIQGSNCVCLGNLMPRQNYLNMVKTFNLIFTELGA